MPGKDHPIWSILNTLLICAACIAPFWFLASNWSDLDEALKTAVSAALVGVVMSVPKVISKLTVAPPAEPCPENKESEESKT